jgi:hypothetical protein
MQAGGAGHKTTAQNLTGVSKVFFKTAAGISLNDFEKVSGAMARTKNHGK